MKIFGSPDTFVEGASSNLKLGRLVANYDFLRALLNYGDFDQYHLFCATKAHVNLLKEAIARDVTDPQLQRRIHLKHHLDIPNALANHHYHAFHMGGWYFYYLRLAYLRAKYAQKPFAITGLIHSLNTPDIQEKMRDILEAPLCAGDAIVMTSACGREVMANYQRRASERLKGLYGVDRNFPGQTPVIPLAVHPDWTIPRDKGAARKALHLSPTETVLLYMGRLSIDSKGDLTPLLYTIKRLVAVIDTPIRLVLAGGGNLVNQRLLKQMIQRLGLASQVLLMPNTTDTVKDNLYAAADVFISPIDSLQETFGISIVEAMASGLPVVAAGFDGYRELVVEGQTGFLLPTLWGEGPEHLVALGTMMEPMVSQLLIAQNVAPNVQVMEKRLLELICNPSLRHRMGEAGRQRVNERFTWPVVIRQYVDLWNQLQHRLPSEVPRGGIDPTYANLHQIFHHYPTHQLQPSQRFTLSELGRQCATGMYPMPSMYTEMQPLFSSPILKVLVEGLSKGWKTWSQVSAEARAAHHRLDQTRFHLLWLVKYGLVEWEDDA